LVVVTSMVSAVTRDEIAMRMRSGQAAEAG
jgi:hypothetical protein